MRLIKTIIIRLYVSFVTERSPVVARKTYKTHGEKLAFCPRRGTWFCETRSTFVRQWLSSLFFNTCFDFCAFGYLDRSRTSGRCFENDRTNEKRETPRTPESKTTGDRHGEGWPANDGTRMREVRPAMQRRLRNGQGQAEAKSHLYTEPPRRLCVRFSHAPPAFEFSTHVPPPACAKTLTVGPLSLLLTTPAGHDRVCD